MEELLFKNYNRIKVELVASDNTLKVLHKKMDKLIGAPQDVKAQSYEEKSFASSSKPIEQVYNEIVELQREINEETLYKELCENLLHEIELKIQSYLKENCSNAELVIFQEHWIKGVPLSEIVVKKDRGKGFLDYRQVLRINKIIKNKITTERES